MRRTAALSLALSLSWMGMAIVPLPTPISGSSIVRAQENNRAAWTDAYATALEDQTDLVLKAQPLDLVLTRIELAQWLTEFFGYRANSGQSVPISDMEPNTPDYITAQAVLQGGIMRAFEGDRFRPEGDVTKLEAIAIMVRALELQAPSDATVNRWLSLYEDSDTLPDVGRPFVAIAGEAGLIVNYPDPTRLNPNLILSRGEGIVLLHQALLSKQQVSPLNPPVAQVSPDPLPKPEIIAIRVSPEVGRVAPGEPITVEVEGTPNANGAVLIGGSIEQPLMEEEPGLYRAVYRPTINDSIANPSVAVVLDLNGERTRSQRQLPELALGNAPAPTAPPPISTNPSLPASSAPSTPALPPPSAPTPTFSSIFVSPQRDLRVGDIFTVGIQGDPGGIAWFDLGTFASQQPMQEIRPGVYEGTYAIATNDFAQEPNLTVTFTKNNRGTFHEEIFPFAVNTATAPSPTAPSPPLIPPPAPSPRPISAPSSPQPSNPPPVNPGLTVQPLIFTSSTNVEGRELRPNDVLEVNMRGGNRGRMPPLEFRMRSPISR